MNGIIEMQLWQFSLVYLLLLIVTVILKKSKVDQTKLLFLASFRMTIQLILAGFILTYIFQNPHPVFTILYLAVMIGFTIYRVLSKNKGITPAFQRVIAFSIAGSGLFVILFFIYIVVGQNISNPQYVIPISGMIMGNTMTGVSLGVKTFRESLNGQRAKINALQCFGAAPDNILLPFMRQALETAMLPTLNSMIGMGIVSLPGMMTGQILSGTLPTTAILYQIAIMISICTVVTMACFGSLYFGYKTFYSKTEQIINI
ncbi:MAG: ABC transporter permease [Clostridiaceae bacterium]